MLEQVAHVNDLSPKLREKLEKKIAGFGKQVRYVFSISHKDPHPDNRGQQVWKNIFKLGPASFTIIDKEEDRPGKIPRKEIGVVKGVDEKGRPNAYKKVEVHAAQKGIYILDLTIPENQDMAAMLELHPKHGGGMFQNKNSPEIFRRVDELAKAKKDRATRGEKTEAMYAAHSFTDQEARDFACAMNWDETEELEMLRNKIEDLAEKDPKFFTDFVNNSSSITYKATVKRAFDRQIIIFIPVENKVIWGESNLPLAVLDRVEGVEKNPVDMFTDWLVLSKNGEDVFKKIRALLK